jgi:hypothetical protein
VPCSAAFEITHDGAHRTRLHAVRLYGLGYLVPQIVEITGCARSSLMEWCAAYRAGGIEPWPIIAGAAIARN